MFGARFNHETRFFADGYELSGVESASLQYNNSPQIQKPLGTKQGFTTANGVTSRTLSVSRVLTYQDPILNLTGDLSTSGNIYYDDRVYGFSTGHLVDYNLNCAVGSVPRVSTNFQIASEFTSGEGIISPQESHPAIDIPTQGSIIIASDNSATNNVIGFDYAIKCNRKAYLTVDKIDIARVELLSPIEFSATVQIDVDDAFLQNSHDFFSEKENKLVSLSISGRSGSAIQDLVIPNASLVGETLNSSADGSLRLTLNYIGHTGSDETLLDSDLTYVFDSSGDVLDSTPADIPAEWKSGDANVYGVQFGNNVGSVGDAAFSGCDNISGDLFIKLSGSSIGVSAFEGCSGFYSSLIFDDDLSFISGRAFYDCNGFVGDLVIPNSTSGVGQSAFEGCYGFDRSLKLPTGYCDLGINAFKDCYGFVGSLTLPNDLMDGKVLSGTFENCSGFNGRLDVGTGVKEFGVSSFKNCTKINNSLVLPNGVTGIKESAFENCGSFIGLSLGGGVLDIGKNSFKNCSSLKSLSIPNSTTGIGDNSFENCTDALSLTLGSSVDYIGSGAFKNCTSIRGSINIPDVSTLANECFYNCKSVDGSLTFGDVSTIGDASFSGCKNAVGSIEFQENLTSIGTKAFYGCESLDGDLSLPTTLSSIGDCAFQNCSFSGSLDISGTSLTAVNSGVFKNCKFSNQLVLPDGVEVLRAESFYGCRFTGSLFIPTGVTGIESSVFEGCENIEDVYVDVPYTYFVGNNAFSNVKGNLYVTKRYYDDYIANLDSSDRFQGMPVVEGSLDSFVYKVSDDSIVTSTSSDIPANWYDGNTTPDVILGIGFNASSVGNQAFQASTNISGDLNIPYSVNSLGFQSFEGCDGFDGELNIQEGLENIGVESFKNCDGFVGNLDLPQTLTGIGNEAFQNCSGFNGLLSLGSNLKGIGQSAFQDCNGFIGDLNIPSGVSEISPFSFLGCSSINGSLGLSEGITKIDSSAFAGCSSISNTLTIPKSVEVIGTNAFKDCNSIQSLILGGGVTGISNNSFQNCDGLFGSITIKSQVESVGDNAFKDCSGLDAVYCDIAESKIGTDSFQIQANSKSDKNLYVRSGDISDYQSAGSPAGYYQGNLIKLWRDDDTITEYYDSSFNVLNSFAGQTLPDEWEDSGTGFYVEFGSNLKGIGQSAFLNNSNLTGLIVIPSNVETIGLEAFRNCPNVSKYIFAEGIKYIKTHAFHTNTSLTEVRLPESLTGIDSQTFYGCNNLERIIVGGDNNPITIIGNNAFDRIQSQPNVTNGYVEINRSVQKIGTSAFRGSNSSVDRFIKSAYIDAEIVGTQAFIDQRNITDLTFGPNLEVVGINNDNSNGQTFRNCIGLTGVALPNPKWVGYQSFYACSNIESIYVGNNTDNTNGTIANEAFRYVGQSKIGLGYAWIGSSISSINYRAFYGDNYFLTGVYIGASSVGDQAFKNQRNLKQVSFGPNVRLLDTECFEKCRITGDILLAYNDSVVGSRVFGDEGTAVKNEIRNVYLNTNIANVDLTEGGSENWANMTGAFYINNPSSNGWTTGVNEGPEGLDVYEWTGYPNIH